MLRVADMIKKRLVESYGNIFWAIRNNDDHEIRLASVEAHENLKDALDLIEQLEAANTKLHEANAELCRTAGRLERERDAAVRDINQMVHDPYEPCFCDYCKLTEEECKKSNCRGRNAFVWRGPQEVTP